MGVPESYCVLPFIHLAVSTTGSVQPCCVSKWSLRKGNGDDYNVASDSLEAIWQSPEMQNLRADMLAGRKPENCNRCWTEERLGVWSKRQRDNKNWKHHVGRKATPEAPVWLDLKLGNLCNLKCRICNPYASSKFGREAHELFKNFDIEKLQNSTKWAEETDGDFWQDLNAWLANVEHFDIYGGEPFLSKPHFAVLEHSVKMGYAKNQTLHYNTNGTVFPEKIVNEVWPHFKSVNVMFSIDGIGEQFEYQRFPANWETVENNIKKFQKHRYLKLDVCFTVNVMNIWSFPEFHYWCRDMGLNYWINYLYDPAPFRAQMFSDLAKEKIEYRLRKMPRESVYRTQIEPMLNYMWDQESTEKERLETLKLIKIYDQHRKQSFEKTFPEAYALLTDQSEHLPKKRPSIFF